MHIKIFDFWSFFQEKKPFSVFCGSNHQKFLNFLLWPKVFIVFESLKYKTQQQYLETQLKINIISPTLIIRTLKNLKHQPRVCQIALIDKGGILGRMGVGNFALGILFTGERWKFDKEFWPFKSFLVLKTTFCKFWTWVKIRISMTLVCIKHDEKKMQGQWLDQK